jgi:two-component system sensor histidine kinase RpfC
MPIIMLTAAASTDLREDSLDAGVDLFLSKPVDPRALLRGVNQVFSQTDVFSNAGTLPPPTPQVEAGYVDRVLLQDMAGLVNDSQFIQTLTSKFSTDAGKPIDEIDADPLQKDYGQFRGLVHALKGAAMMAGAIRLRESVARAERVADSDFNSARTEMIKDLRRTLEATSHELSRLVAYAFAGTPMST